MKIYLSLYFFVYFLSLQLTRITRYHPPTLLFLIFLKVQYVHVCCTPTHGRVSKHRSRHCLTLCVPTCTHSLGKKIFFLKKKDFLKKIERIGHRRIWCPNHRQ